MIWEEVLIDRSLSRDEIAIVLATLFSIASADIIVVDSITEVPANTCIKVLCELIPVKGNFSRKLSIYVHDPILEQIESKPIIGQFSEILHCKCLISDESHDPYAMLLMQGKTDQRLVYLNPQRLDDEEYVIATPFPA